MIVRIFSLKKGLEIIENVIAIRIKSKDYHLLILKDYVSHIGEIHGDMEIELENDLLSFNDIDAMFINDNNIFNVIYEEEKWLIIILN